MSYDVFVQTIPAEVKTVADMRDDYVAKVIGKRSEVIAKILEVVPTADFSNPAWGVIDGDGFWIEVNIGEAEDCAGFALHIRGGDEAMELAGDIIEHLGLRAFDPQSETGLFERGPRAERAYERWRAYRDQVVGGGRRGWVSVVLDRIRRYVFG